MSQKQGLFCDIICNNLSTFTRRQIFHMIPKVPHNDNIFCVNEVLDGILVSISKLQNDLKPRTLMP